MDERISERPREGGDQDFAVGGGLQMARKAAEEDAGVGADAGFGVGLGLGEVAEEIVVQNSVVELWVRAGELGRAAALRRQSTP